MMRSLLLLLAIVTTIQAKPAIDVTIKNRNLLNEGVEFRNDPQNLALLQLRALVSPTNSSYLDINAYSFLDYTDTTTYEIDNSHYYNGRVGVHYTQDISEWNLFLGASGNYQLSDSTTKGVKFLDNPVNKKSESYVQAGFATPNEYAQIKSYLIHEGYSQDGDTAVSFTSSYNVISALSPKLPGNLYVGLESTLKPVLNSELQTGDTVYADYYMAGASVTRKDNFINGLDLNLGVNGDYGMGIYSDRWISSGISYEQKLGNHRLFSNFFNEYSTQENIVYKQELEVGIFRNLLTPKMNQYGYKAMVRFIDKRGTISYLSRIEGTLFIVKSLYCTPLIYGYLNTMSKQLTTRESIQLGYRIRNGLDIYCKPQFEHIVTQSYEMHESNWYITSGMQFTF